MNDEKDEIGKIEISEIEIIPVKPNNGLVAFGACVFDEKLFLGDIAIRVTPTGGYRLVYPAKKINNRNLHIYYPINKFIGTMIEKAIVDKYQKITLQATKSKKVMNYDDSEGSEFKSFS